VPDDPQPTDPEPETPELRALPDEQRPGQTADDDALPTPEELAAAPDATIRHAPKFGAFIAAGAIVGFFVGLVATALVGPEIPLVTDGSGLLPFLDGENAIRTVMAVSGAVLGGFVGALCAVVADRRSVRRTGRRDV
jgi:hypothetical protein